MAAQSLHRHRSIGWKVQMAAIAGAVLVCSLPVHAQLDPLLFLKRIPPNVLLVVDTRAGLSQDSLYTKTRYNVARTALTQVIAENSNYARFGLLKMRQSSPVWGTLSTSGQTQSPRLNDLSTSPDQRTNTDTTKTGLWYVVRNTVLANNGSITTVQTPLVKPDSSSANSNVST